MSAAESLVIRIRQRAASSTPNVQQGPVQRWFQIANLMVSTAGGGGGVAAEQQHGSDGLGAHVGLIEGISNAHEIRDSKLRAVEAWGTIITKQINQVALSLRPFFPENMSRYSGRFAI